MSLKKSNHQESNFANMYRETLEMEKKCIGCGQLIHPKRIEILPNTKTCAPCSSTGMKRGVPIMHGNVEKDDTWVDMIFMEEEQYRDYEKRTGRSS